MKSVSVNHLTKTEKDKPLDSQNLRAAHEGICYYDPTVDLVIFAFN